MSCELFLPLISAYRDGELEEADVPRVMAHLEDCRACTSELEALERIANLLGEQVPMPSPDEWATFDAGLRRDLAEVRHASQQPRTQRLLMVGAALAASLLIAIYLSARVAEPSVVLAMPHIVFPSLHHTDPRFRQQPPAPMPRLSEVRDADAAASVLSRDAVASLTRYGLVQVRTDAGLDKLYPIRVPPGVPAPFATADASLLLYGAVSSRAGLVLEREVLIPGVKELLTLLGRELRIFELAGRTREVREAARMARERIGVAVALYRLTPMLPEDSQERVRAEVARIVAGKSVEPSPLLGRQIDYRAFVPRGIYGGDPDRDHARVIRWLSLTGLSMDGSRPTETRAACLIVMALARGQLASGRGYGLAGQARLEAAVEVLWGEPDELTPFDVLRCMKQGLRSPAPKLSVLADHDALGAVIARATIEAEARGANQIRSLGESGTQLCLLGNTRTVEARVYTRLTSPSVPRRNRPTSLDLLYLLGSRRRARSIVSAERLDALGYDEALDSLEPEAMAWRDPTRPVPYRSSLERGRLLALSALIDGQVSEGPLPFMGSSRYRDRLLLAAFTGLNTPQAGADRPWQEPELGDAPLVEPLPRFHARLASSANRLAGVLELLGAGRPRVARAVRDLRRVVRMEEALRDASLDVIAGRPPAPEVNAVLREYSSTLSQLGPAELRSAEDLFELKHQDGEVSILNRVVTRVDRLYVVTLDPVTKKPRLACGAALAGGEVWVKGKRLTLDDLKNTPVHDPLWATHLELGGPR